MNILTFDIEDWYNCDFISENNDWTNYEVRIYRGVEKILTELNKRNLKGTFFCLGWIAENHPDVIRMIDKEGHHIGCHSYQHELSFRFEKKEFEKDTTRAKYLLEEITGKTVDAFRAPGFSIRQSNKWALESLVDMGFLYDCSIFPGYHDYGGMSTYGKGTPAIIHINERKSIKEFPVSVYSLFGKKIIYSGGGFFRLFPYLFINYWGKNSEYMMTYFHPRDFDKGQPRIKTLPWHRQFKSYVGIEKAFSKFQSLLDDYDFVDLLQADQLIDWDKVRKIYLHEL